MVERWRVINTVACHCADISLLLSPLKYSKLVIRSTSCNHVRKLASFNRILNSNIKILCLNGPDIPEACLTGYLCSRLKVVAGHHHNVHACSITLFNRHWYIRSYRILYIPCSYILTSIYGLSVLELHLDLIKI